MRIDVTPASTTDEADWRRLWQGYCDFYDAPVTETQTNLTWARILAADHPICSFLARDASGVAVGMVTYLTHPSTWIDVGDCYLEDLFVAETVRGGGVGRALIAAVEAKARAMGCERLYWNTGIDNTRARGLYDKIAGPEDGHVRYRMTLD